MSAGSPLDPSENRRGALGPGQRALLAATIPGLPFGGGGRMTEAQRAELGRLPPSHIAYGVAVMAAVMAGLTAMGVMRAIENGDSLFGVRTIGGAIVTPVLLAYLPVAVREQRRSGAGARADVAEGAETGAGEPPLTRSPLQVPGAS